MKLSRPLKRRQSEGKIRCSTVIPPPPEDASAIPFYEKLKEFAMNETADSLTFPPTLSKAERVMIHSLADAFHFHHWSITPPLPSAPAVDVAEAEAEAATATATALSGDAETEWTSVSAKKKKKKSRPVEESDEPRELTIAKITDQYWCCPGYVGLFGLKLTAQSLDIPIDRLIESLTTSQQKPTELSSQPTNSDNEHQLATRMETLSISDTSNNTSSSTTESSSDTLENEKHEHSNKKPKMKQQHPKKQKGKQTTGSGNETAQSPAGRFSSPSTPSSGKKKATESDVEELLNLVERDSELFTKIPRLATYLRNRLNRDGLWGEHITLLLYKEFAQARDSLSPILNRPASMDDLMDFISNIIEDDWTDIGVGRVEDGDNETYFKVVEWPSANRVRTEIFKLPPRDFHITIGFKDTDIHSQLKDRSSLVASAPAQLLLSTAEITNASDDS